MWTEMSLYQFYYPKNTLKTSQKSLHNCRLSPPLQDRVSHQYYISTHHMMQSKHVYTHSHAHISPPTPALMQVRCGTDDLFIGFQSSALWSQRTHFVIWPRCPSRYECDGGNHNPWNNIGSLEGCFGYLLVCNNGLVYCHQMQPRNNAEMPVFRPKMRSCCVIALQMVTFSMSSCRTIRPHQKEVGWVWKWNATEWRVKGRRYLLKCVRTWLRVSLEWLRLF